MNSSRFNTDDVQQQAWFRFVYREYADELGLTVMPASDGLPIVPTHNVEGTITWMLGKLNIRYATETNLGYMYFRSFVDPQIRDERNTDGS